MAENNARPTSPHLQIYKLPLTGIISITHRMTGVFLSVGLLVFVYIILALAGGGDSYIDMQTVMSVWIMKLIVLGFIYALMFHLCHGIRHLFWDSGRTFEFNTMNKYAIIELSASIILTLITLIWV